jgi:tetratricopeptide (TPR) repeat protein
MASRSSVITREVLVAAWLVLAFGFLWVRLPGFWRSPYQRFEEARRLDSAGRSGDASTEMALAIDEEPANSGYLVYQGNLQLRLGRLAEAEQSFRAALSRGLNVEASLGLARALQSRPDEARRVLRELPRTLNHDQRFRRLALLAAMGDFAAAVSDLDPIERELTLDERRDAVRWAMAANDWTRAERLAGQLEQATSSISRPGPATWCRGRSWRSSSSASCGPRNCTAKSWPSRRTTSRRAWPWPMRSKSPAA